MAEWMVFHTLVQSRLAVQVDSCCIIFAWARQIQLDVEKSEAVRILDECSLLLFSAQNTSLLKE